MKKWLKTIIPVFAFAFILLIAGAQAQAGTISSVRATAGTNEITVSGVAGNEVLSVVIFVYDSTGKTLLQMKSVAVDSNHAYTDKFEVEKGTYVVKVADYEGGAFSETKVTVGSIVTTTTAPTTTTTTTKATTTTVAQTTAAQTTAATTKATSTKAANTTVATTAAITTEIKTAEQALAALTDLKKATVAGSKLNNAAFANETDYATFVKALEAANKVLSNPKATDSEKAAALETLKVAMSKAKEAELVSAVKVAETVTTTTKTETKKTGDTSPIVVLILVAMASFGTAVVVFRKKKHN